MTNNITEFLLVKVHDELYEEDHDEAIKIVGI